MDAYEAKTPHDAWERWCGNQSVREFMHYSEGLTVEQAAANYCGELRRDPPPTYGHGPTEAEESLLVEYLRSHGAREHA